MGEGETDQEARKEVAIERKEKAEEDAVTIT
jgi:hypothetical protein